MDRDFERRWALIEEMLGAEARGDAPRPFASQRTLFGIPSSVEQQIEVLVAQDEERYRKKRRAQARGMEQREDIMDELIKNVAHTQVFGVADLVEYEAGKVNSLTLSQTPSCKMTVFAIDEGEGMSSHAAPGDALAFVLEGTAEITIEGTPFQISAGNAIVMSKGAPHAVKGLTPFKMLLTVVIS